MPYAKNDGVRLYYEAIGSGEETVVLIPGLGLSGSAWGTVTTNLAADFRVLTIDPRGAGRSDTPDVPYTGTTNAGDLISVLDHARVKTANVVGMSMGGMMAQELALRYSDRVCTLVLASTYAATDAWSQRLFEVRETMIRELGILEQFKLSIMFVFSPFAFRRMADRVAAIEASLTANPPDTPAYLRQMTFCMDHDTRDRLAGIAAPTLVVTGLHDCLTSPLQGRELALAIPNAEYIEFAEASHGLIFEEEERFAELVRNHVVRVAQEEGVQP